MVRTIVRIPFLFLSYFLAATAVSFSMARYDISRVTGFETEGTEDWLATSRGEREREKRRKVEKGVYGSRDSKESLRTQGWV